jgi:hypothetical protein
MIYTFKYLFIQLQITFYFNPIKILLISIQLRSIVLYVPQLTMLLSQILYYILVEWTFLIGKFNNNMIFFYFFKSRFNEYFVLVIKHVVCIFNMCF